MNRWNPVRRVLLGQNAHVALRERILARRPDLDVRGNTYTALTVADLEWAEVYVGFRRPPLPTLGNVRWVHCTGAGVDAWLHPTPLADDVLLTRTPESFGPMIAEWALGRALAIVQQVVPLAQAQRAHEWASPEVGALRGSRVLVVGTGDIGTHVGRLFAALGCNVRGVSRTGRADPAVFSSVTTPDQLPQVVGDADWIIVTLPLTAATRGLIGREVLERCRGAALLNAGRGAVIDEALLPVALENGWLRAAALDVFEVEPLPATSPLWDDARVIVSPHVSGLTTLDGAADGFLECLATFERGQTPRWLVDRVLGY